MNKPRTPAITIVIAVGAFLVSLFLFYFQAQKPYSTPQKAVSAMVAAVNHGDLGGFESSFTVPAYQNFIGHFGERKYEQVRSIYQTAYGLADPRWREYRRRAESAAAAEHEKLMERINMQGRE